MPDATFNDFNPEELKRLRDILTRNRNSDQTLPVKLVEDGSLALVGRSGGAHYEITEKGWERIRR